MRNRSRNISHAFTLAELLVVIGIIAVLVALLLPALSKARAAANTAYCAANLRNITQAMFIYASENDGWILGSGNTTGAVLADPANASVYNVTSNFAPGALTVSDWMSPTALVMGVPFDDGSAPSDALIHYTQLATFKGFLCPGNEVLAAPSTTNVPNQGPMQMTSYVTAAAFLCVYYTSTMSSASYYKGRTTTYHNTEFNVPPGYVPKLNAIHPPASKVYIADGGKFADGSTSPDIDLNPTDGYYHTPFSDPGPWYTESYAWNRGNAPLNPYYNVGYDPRIYGYRHGHTTPNGPADSFRFNVAFYDGHVQTLGDLEGANPALWLPTGTTVSYSYTEPDVQTAYHIPTGTYVIQN